MSGSQPSNQQDMAQLRRPIPKQAKFVWPPRPIGDDHRVEGDGARPVGRIDGHAHSPWEVIEREWLCVGTATLSRRLADAGVVPDALTAYCWRCGRSVGPYETDAYGCSKCRGTRLGWDRFVRLGEYQAPWNQLVQEVKFSQWPRLGQDLGRLLGTQLRAALPDLNERRTVVVPVPTNVWRRLARGIDHSMNLARGVSAELRVPLRPMLRKARRPEQTRLSATDRQQNLRRSMSRSWTDMLLERIGMGHGVQALEPARPCRVILIDDISTTGATLAEASRAVRRVCKVLQILDLEIVAGVICRTEERQ